MDNENHEKAINIRALMKQKDDEIGLLQEMWQQMQNNSTSWLKIAKELSQRFGVAIAVPQEGI